MHALRVWHLFGQGAGHPAGTCYAATQQELGITIMLAAGTIAATLQKLRLLLQRARNLKEFYNLDAAALAELGIVRHDVAGRTQPRREIY